MSEQDPFTSIPLIDLAEPFPAAAAAIERAFREVGFLYVRNHGIAEDLIAGVFEAARRFHALPLAQKQALAVNAWHRGYIGFASSTIVTSSVETGVIPNQSESFMVMHEVAEDDPARLAGKPLQGPNQWPADLPGFRDVVTAYDAAAEAAGRRLAGLIEAALGLTAGRLAPLFERPTTFLRMIHYPPQPEVLPDKQYGSSPHTDHGFITLLLQDDSGGLEVQNDRGDWVAAPPLPGTLVVNIGDMAALISGGRWRSTRHRVINRSGRERYSVPYFFDPHMESMIAPLLPGPEGAPPPEPVHYGRYLMARLDANYDYRREGETASGG